MTEHPVTRNYGNNYLVPQLPTFEEVVKNMLRENTLHEKENPMSKTYFGDDGNYGLAKDLLIFDTTEWTPEMWREIEDAEPDRASLAVHFSSGTHLWKDAMCNTCGLTPFELGVIEP